MEEANDSKSVNSIINNYSKGIEAINKECEDEVVDPNKPIPDYSLL